MTTEIARDRLQQVAQAAIAGNRLMARLELEAAMEFAAESPEAWLWQAWTSGSPREAKEALSQALSRCPDHPLAATGLAWVTGLEQLATEGLDASTKGHDEPAEDERAEDEPADAAADGGSLSCVASPTPIASVRLPAAQAPSMRLSSRSINRGEPLATGDPEGDLLATLTAIHDEIFATLNADDLCGLISDGPAPLLRPQILSDSRSPRR